MYVTKSHKYVNDLQSIPQVDSNYDNRWRLITMFGGYLLATTMSWAPSTELNVYFPVTFKLFCKANLDYLILNKKKYALSIDTLE